jgi:hypothetical protein
VFVARILSLRIGLVSRLVAATRRRLYVHYINGCATFPPLHNLFDMSLSRALAVTATAAVAASATVIVLTTAAATVASVMVDLVSHSGSYPSVSDAIVVDRF